MKANFDNKNVMAAFYEIAKEYGEAKKIDTKSECKKLAEYISGNADNLSANDLGILNRALEEGLKDFEQVQQKSASKAPTNNIELDLDVEEGSISQINIGDDNKNTVIIKNEAAKPSMGLAAPNKDVAKPTEDKKPVDVSVDKKPVDVPVDKKVDKKPVDDSVDRIPEDRLYIDDYGKVRDKKTGGICEFKYNIWVDMQPGPGPARDLNYIKDSVISQIKDFPLPYIDDACNVVKSCRSQVEVTFCLACYGIGIKYPV